MADKELKLSEVMFHSLIKRATHQDFMDYMLEHLSSPLWSPFVFLLLPLSQLFQDL
jgi:uncharacterized membrane protein YcfT